MNHKSLCIGVIVAANGFLQSCAPTNVNRPPEFLLGGAHAFEPDGRTADLRDKVVVLHFWASWCGYCMEELPQAVARHAVRWAQIVDHDAARQVTDLYNVHQIPKVVLIDSTGRTRWSGVPPAGLEQHFSEVLRERDSNLPLFARLQNVFTTFGAKAR